MRGSLTALSLLALGASCIPSHRIVHDGNHYFEYCYGADFDPTVVATSKESCWQAWLAHYTRHQPAHRVDFAMRRVEALQAGEPPLSLPGLGEIRGGSSEQAPPDPTLLALASGNSPPLAMNSQGELTADAGALSSEIPNGCLDACNGVDSRCVAACPTGNIICRVGCARERAICLGGCH